MITPRIPGSIIQYLSEADRRDVEDLSVAMIQVLSVVIAYAETVGDAFSSERRLEEYCALGGLCESEVYDAMAVLLRLGFMRRNGGGFGLTLGGMGAFAVYAEMEPDCE